MSNPLLEEWNTPHAVPPYDKIATSDYLPAIEAAIVEHNAEITGIATNPEPPTFENTIEALEAAGSLLDRIAPVFYVLVSADADDEIRELQTKISPMLTAHRGAIATRQDLFQRVKAVHDAPPAGLSNEQRRLLEETWNTFVRAGAALPDDARSEVLAIDQQLSSLQTRFGQNVVKDANTFELVLETEEELAGLPHSVRRAAAREAKARGKDGKYVFTISRSSITPFLEYSSRRDLRETMWRAYTQCADNGGDFDNNETLARIATLRARRAKLMGYASHADFVLDDRMAKTPAGVRELLDAIWTPARRRVREEAGRLQDRIQSEGSNFSLAPWDWWYYTQKIRAEEYALDEEETKPYFSLPAVRQGAFDVATRLYGITFHPREDIPVYHEDVEAFEVHDADGSLIGLFLTDYYMRPSKRSGAWMNAIRNHSTFGGQQYPVVFNTCNFAKGDPALLGPDEVRTLFHEFGHGLHGLLSKVGYKSLSGTSVKRDFVELPSQIMEHWAVEPEVMRSYAKHVETGETIPDEMIDKILATQTFNQGFATTEYLAASYLDMDWHEIGEDQAPEAESFETAAMNKIDLVPEVAPRYRSTYFQHIFSGGYSAGYYSYIWAEVLDADAYDAFTENGIFDEKTATSFRRNILEKGGTAEPMDLYKAFRGREPSVGPLLRGRGLD
ncbi:MAG: M3 family metallopeptidase [Pseudomonadales bacterium]|nr:M3 family metallopeptidase [Pseudomonadales bacterium]